MTSSSISDVAISRSVGERSQQKIVTNRIDKAGDPLGPAMDLGDQFRRMTVWLGIPAVANRLLM